MGKVYLVLIACQKGHTVSWDVPLGAAFPMEEVGGIAGSLLLEMKPSHLVSAKSGLISGLQTLYKVTHIFPKAQ